MQQQFKGYLELNWCWVHRGSVLPEGKFQQADEVRLRIDSFNKTTEWLYLWQTEVDSCQGLYQSSSFERKEDTLVVMRFMEQYESCSSKDVEKEILPERNLIVKKTSRGFSACVEECFFSSDRLDFESIVCDSNFPFAEP